MIVHANCVRIQSHSNSDKHELYRDDYELKYAKDNEPIEKFMRMLKRYQRMSQEEISVIREKAENEVKNAHQRSGCDFQPRRIIGQ